MVDDFFDTKRYIGKWTPIFHFEELGDTDNFFIELEYFINKSRYLSTKSEIGSTLNIELLDGDGYGIFADLPLNTRERLIARGYKLASISEGKPHNPEGDLFVVTETYTYAPNKEYVSYENDIVPIWGLQDDSNGVSAPVVFGRNCKWKTEFYNRTKLQVANIAAFNTGDTVAIYAQVGFYKIYGLATIYRTLYKYEVEVPEACKIVKIDRAKSTIDLERYITLSDNNRHWHENDADYRENDFIACEDCFYRRIEGGVGTPIYASATRKILSMRVVKKYSTREFKRRDRPDYDSLNDPTQLTALKETLKEDLSVDLDNLMELVRRRESRLANRTDIALNLPNETITYMDNIIVTDGDVVNESTRANLLEDLIDSKYSEYQAEGRFDSAEDTEGDEA